MRGAILAVGRCLISQVLIQLTRQSGFGDLFNQWCEQAIFTVDRLTGLKGLGKGFNIDFKFIVRLSVSLPV